MMMKNIPKKSAYIHCQPQNISKNVWEKQGNYTAFGVLTNIL